MTKRILVLAELSNEVYQPDPSYLDNGYSAVKDGIQQTPITGFSAQSFFNSNSNTLVIAYAGTNILQGGDWRANEDLMRGQVPTQQGRQALEFASQQIDALRAGGNADFEVVYTGHSLGGALAQYAHLSRCDGRAVVFNSPGVNDNFPTTAKPDVQYVYSNPSEWNWASFIHNHGQHVGDNIVYVMGADGHGIEELIEAIDQSDAETLNPKELKELIARQFLEADGQSDVTTVFDTWSQQDLFEPVVMPAYEEANKIKDIVGSPFGATFDFRPTTDNPNDDPDTRVSLSDIDDNKIVLGGLNEIGKPFFTWAKELKPLVDKAKAFKITEDQLVRGQLDGGADLNGPEAVFNLFGDEFPLPVPPDHLQSVRESVEGGGLSLQFADEDLAFSMPVLPDLSLPNTPPPGTPPPGTPQSATHIPDWGDSPFGEFDIRCVTRVA